MWVRNPLPPKNYFLRFIFYFITQWNAKKCKEAEPLTKVSSNSNSTDIDTSSFIPNSQECINISSNNIVAGKRQRKPSKK